VGDTVVYAAHGVGKVIAHEQKRLGDTERDCLVIDLASGLRITLPLQEAAERLRAVAGKAELEDVRRTLASPPTRPGEPWTKRIKESKEKLASGRPVDLAELVRDGDRFRQAKPAELSQAERTVYLRARALLVIELCAALGVTETEAEAWIEAQTALADRNED
jgi:CarD family transcriptional regulator, regulator of rRNA transcription